MDAPSQGVSARIAASRLLSGVEIERRMLSDQTHGPNSTLARLTPSERARAQSIAAGVLRCRDALDAILDPHFTKNPPLKARHILRIVAWEVLVDGIPAHAAVDSAVIAAKASKKTAHLAKLINAVARKVCETPPSEIAKAPPQALPKYLRVPIERAYGAEAADRMEAVFTAPPPIDLTLKDPGSADHWAKVLDADILPTGSLRLKTRPQITALDGYDTGAWWVQDAAAAMPVQMLGDISGISALDLCAAPGGKTMQLAARGAQVTALDSSAARLERLSENMQRTGLSADIVASDLRNWTPPRPFDVIVLDAPCSATGTIRRHPDLPIVRRDANLQPVFKLQKEFLRHAANWLAPNGRLLYCTCSLLPAEGELAVESVKDVLSIVPITNQATIPGDCLSAEGTLRTRPDIWADRGGMDGFYAAVLQKI